jgi:Mycothiol maleylpyruvate isomerase N-terminal domain
MTITTLSRPRIAALPREVAIRLAATEYQRFADMLRSLGPGDWAKPTECPGWDVRAMAAHALGMVEMAASIRETNRQLKLARARGEMFMDGPAGCPSPVLTTIGYHTGDPDTVAR